MVQKINLAHVPPDLAIYAALYTNVENARFLKEQLLAGNSEFEYAFIDASVVGHRLRLWKVFTLTQRSYGQIISTTHVLAAGFCALYDYLNERLKSRNVHAEIVFSLSPNNNVRSALPLVTPLVLIVVKDRRGFSSLRGR
jgi:EKC/KEOPS complex subunit CGI121/TPRKB